jgi:hypothetical protein
MSENDDKLQGQEKPVVVGPNPTPPAFLRDLLVSVRFFLTHERR